MSDAAKKKAKQRWIIEKPKLHNARQLRGTFFIEPNDEAFKLTKKAARRKLEVPMPAAMPCKNTDAIENSVSLVIRHIQASGNRCRKVKEIAPRQGKPIMLVKKNLRLRRDYLKRRLNWT